MLAIEINGLTKEYRVGFWKTRVKRALNSLNLQVESGEVFGLLGPNGAGKTTTLKILFRLVFPTSGTARILGKELNDTTMHQRVGYLPEHPYFYDHLTPEELLHYTGRLFGLGERRSCGAASINSWSEWDLPSPDMSRLRRFSKGMVQRAGIAQALINDPDVVFLDEPMTGLDPIGRREVRDLVLQLREEKKTVFFSTHILSDAETLCDRVAILNRGQLQGCGELRQILSLGASATELILENPPEAVLEELRPLVVLHGSDGGPSAPGNPRGGQHRKGLGDFVARQGESDFLESGKNVAGRLLSWPRCRRPNREPSPRPVGTYDG